MVEQITLRYGGRLLTLTKSGQLAAVRIRPGGHGALRRALAALPATAGRPSATGQVLGGFHLIDLGAGTHAEADARLDLLRRDGAVAACSHVFHTSDDGVPFVPTGEIYVRFRPGADVTARAALLDRFALDAVERRAEDTLVVRIGPGSPNPVRTAAALQTSAIVAVAEPDMATPGQMRGAEPPPPVGAPLTDGGTAAGGLKAADARVVGAWVAGRSVGSPAVVVGVIDDGRDPAHPHRAGPSGGLANAAAWDPAHDVHRPPPDVPDPGLPVGRADGRQVLGAAPGATVVSIGAGHDLAVAEVERWFDRATERGAWIVSCRWGPAARVFPLSERHRDAIARCARGGRGGKDCVIVVAAGNDGRDIDDPAGRTLDGLAVHPDTIAVATPRSLGGTAGDSDFGDRIWACAPPGGIDGRGVPTADDGIRASASGHRHPPSIWPAKSPDRPPRGRASACTLVAGICALVLTANPDLTAAEVKRLLARTARRVGPAEAYENGHSRRFGYGCVDAEAAVRGAIALRYAAADAAAD